MVYQEVYLQNESVSPPEDISPRITMSVDEKPGVQAIGNTAPDRSPNRGSMPRLPGIMNTYVMEPCP